MTQTVVFTREQALDADLAQTLQQVGLEVAHVPLIACRPNPLPKSLVGLIDRADWILFTSAVAVSSFEPYWPQKPLQIATIGPQTTLAVKERGYEVAFEASSHYAVDFAQEWLAEVADKQTVLLPQSSLSNPVIADALTKAGHEVLAWAMYDTKPNAQGQALVSAYLNQPQVMWAFASPSAWQSFRQVVRTLPDSHEIAVIGTSTAKAVTQDGFAVAIMPEKPIMSAMVATMVDIKKGG